MFESARGCILSVSWCWVTVDKTGVLTRTHKYEALVLQTFAFRATLSDIAIFVFVGVIPVKVTGGDVTISVLVPTGAAPCIALQFVS